MKSGSHQDPAESAGASFPDDPDSAAGEGAAVEVSRKRFDAHSTLSDTRLKGGSAHEPSELSPQCWCRSMFNGQENGKKRKPDLPKK
jgi:hypothetical protein